jgi:DNA mismatch repair protein MutL
MELTGVNMNPENSRIQMLPDALIDQIAAGEVVERPASVVKELVENALDAGATRIRIEIRDGGRGLVAVTDDGVGMTPQSARQALKRHATSKISSLADLERIASFGFRGEALPAIASVSRMRLFSRARGQNTGCAINLEAGAILDEGEAGGPEGTRIEVADLFAKIPARRKFLKSEGTEWGHISDWTRRLALALPGIHFEVRRDDRAPIVWPATGDPLDRIAAVLGEREADGLVPVECELSTGHLQAFISAPEDTRANANAIYLFVNGRPVRDKVMRHALLQAYRDVLPRGRFPSAVLFLTVPTAEVDVNVHPAKWEVRFADPQAIHQLIRRGVRDAMGQRQWLEHTEPGQQNPPERSGGAVAPQSRSESHAGEAGLVRESASSDWVLAESGNRSSAQPTEPAALPGLATPTSEPRSPSLQFGNLRLLGQLLASYLLVEGKEGLLMVDQHAAHERVLYERLRAEWLDRGVERQGLLLSIEIELDPLAANALAEQSETVERLGFEIEPFGEGAVVVRSIPALLSGRDPTPLVRDLAAELQALPVGPADDSSSNSNANSTSYSTANSIANSIADSPADLRLLSAADRVFATLACHSARRAGDHLESHEQQQILKDLDTIPWAPTCPHGRPVAVAYSLPEIERRFARR